MSIECSNLVWSRNFSGSSRKMVAVKLADHADDEGRGIWPSVEKVAARCDLSCRTVQRVLSDFVREGILRVVAEGGSGPKDTRRYDFDMPTIRALPLAVAPPDSRSVKPENKGDTVSPLDDAKGDTDDAKGDTDDKKGCHRVTQTIIEPPIEPSLERACEREAEKTDHGRLGDKGFERAFAAWPTFVSDSKPAAKKAWDGLTTEDRVVATKRQAEYVATVKATGRSKFCAYAVYLSERRWEKLAELPMVSKIATAPAFGPAWGAVRIKRLLAGPVDLGPPEVTRESRLAAYQAMSQLWNVERAQAYCRKLGNDFDAHGTMLFPDDFDQAQALVRQLGKGFPDVNSLHSGRGLAGAEAEEGTALAAFMEFVQTDTPRFEEWRRLHEDRGWPWLASFERARGVYFPAGGPDQLETFERAVRGDEHAA